MVAPPSRARSLASPKHGATRPGSPATPSSALPVIHIWDPSCSAPATACSAMAAASPAAYHGQRSTPAANPPSCGHGAAAASAAPAANRRQCTGSHPASRTAWSRLGSGSNPASSMRPRPP
eukprot:scaffold394_cov112-Isochrysis_galbana.AAC.8